MDDNLVLVRAINIVRPQADLPAHGAARGRQDIIFAVDLVSVRSLEVGVLLPVEDLLLANFHGKRVRIEFRYKKGVLSMDHIHTPVVIKEQSRIVKILREDRSRPGAGNVGGGTHGKMAVPVCSTAAIWRAEANIKDPVTIPNC